MLKSDSGAAIPAGRTTWDGYANRTTATWTAAWGGCRCPTLYALGVGQPADIWGSLAGGGVLVSGGAFAVSRALKQHYLG